MREEIKQRIEQIRHGEVPEGYKETKAGVIPNEWELCMISDCLEKVDNPVSVEPDALYTQIGIRSHGKGLFYKDPVTGRELGNKSVFWVEPNCFVLNIVFAWEQAFGKTTNNEVGMIASHRFPMYHPINNSVDLNYLICYFLTKRGTDILDAASPGGAGRNRTLGQDRFIKSKIMLPPLAEQKKIAEILSAQDKLIALKEKLIEEKKRQKKALIKQILNDKAIKSKFSAHWETVELKDVFDYIQPTKYLVESTDYSDDYETPVLTAGKSFILGYTNEIHGIFDQVPAVIFDDFTTDSKYVDFPFKAKSSAMKILMVKDGFDIQFAFELLQNIDYNVGGHERHWISVFSQMTVDVPPYEVQQKIGQIIQCVNNEIDLLQKDLDQEKQKKKALMQLLLTGIVRV